MLLFSIPTQIANGVCDKIEIDKFCFANSKEECRAKIQEAAQECVNKYGKYIPDNFQSLPPQEKSAISAQFVLCSVLKISQNNLEKIFTDPRCAKMSPPPVASAKAAPKKKTKAQGVK